MPKCRCCGREINKADAQSWIMPSKNWYYHNNCYKDWVSKKDDVMATAEDDEWKDLLWDYLRRDAKVPDLNFQKFEQQWHLFLYKNKKKMTAKGLFFSCRYFYEILHGKREEAQGGIGILPYIYDDSCTYWTYRANVSKEVCEKIEEQISQFEKRETITIKQRETKKERKTMSLTDVLALEDEE